MARLSQGEHEQRTGEWQDGQCFRSSKIQAPSTRETPSSKCEHVYGVPQWLALLVRHRIEHASIRLELGLWRFSWRLALGFWDFLKFVLCPSSCGANTPFSEDESDG